MSEALRVPSQPRAKRTYEALLSAAQGILAESGYDGLTSNTVVARAGLTPPAFYRYFRDKHMMLLVLAERLLDAQNALIDEHLRRDDGTFAGSVEATANLMLAEIELTKSFTGGVELMLLMRTLPELSELRLQAHDTVSTALANELIEQDPESIPSTISARTRLATELYYSTVEMLFETGFRQQEEIIQRAAIALQAVIGWGESGRQSPAAEPG